MSEAVAEGIREQFAEIIDGARVVQDTFSENVGVQVYLRPESPPKIFVHLINYDYNLESDTVYDQEDLPLAVALPTDFEVTTITVISPDFEGAQDLDFTLENGYVQISVPELHIWDVIIIE